MHLFTSDLYRNFAIGFGAGAIAVAVQMMGDAGTAAQAMIAALL